jgi:hypothetical protein
VENHAIVHHSSSLSGQELATWYVKLQEVANFHDIKRVTPEHAVNPVNLSYPLGMMLCNGIYGDKR